ncbi:MAG: DUF1648 domain-containing protein [Patescibacteria group bacterium]|nr:MAG: DUF1648 domain-containing protein [Patescibacteria group bacterium]
MTTKTSSFLLALLIVGGVWAAFFAYNILPDQVVAHWDASGRPDGYMGKFWALFLWPMIIVLFTIFFVLLPKIDPIKNGIASFRRVYNMFWLILSIFILYILLIILSWNFGFKFNFIVLILPALAFVWFCLGELLANSKRNWFVGIRTPWTMSSDKVWQSTHFLAGKLYKISAVFALLGLAFKGEQGVALAFGLIPVIVSALGLVVFSYFEYKRLQS